MGETVYVRSCRWCGEAFDSTNEAASESARNAHETGCYKNPAVSN